ncbi:MAG: UDP-N-acetylmuramate dehydrogenase, partial [Syntrophales bacterium]|nr:UDP-N-acetylmuramate dehydrogenase [Syntrophales bacterium]
CDGRVEEVPAADLTFTYRCLHLPADHVILGADLRLRRGDREAMLTAVADIMAKRRDKHPLEYASAGSIFKNPPGMLAGRLIEEAGLKGITIGGAQVSERHGNFIVNRGGATAGDVLALIDMVREKVRALTGITLETEVIIIGDER